MFIVLQWFDSREGCSIFLSTATPRGQYGPFVQSIESHFFYRSKGGRNIELFSRLSTAVNVFTFTSYSTARLLCVRRKSTLCSMYRRLMYVNDWPPCIIIIIIITLTYAISPCDSDYTIHLQDVEVATTVRNRNESRANPAARSKLC